MTETTIRRLALLARFMKPLISTRSEWLRLFRRHPKAAVRMPVAMGGLSFPMVLHPRDHVDFELFYAGYYERAEGHLFASLCPEGGVVFDIGANIGYYTIAAALRVGRFGQVHAFEPYPATYHRLTANTALNDLKNVKLNQYALSDRQGILPMYVVPDHLYVNSGSNSLGKREGAVESDNVPLIPLDDYVIKNKIEQLNLIKIDIEGAEVQALRGMSETLSRFRPHMILEFNAYCLSLFGLTVHDLAAAIRGYGYQLFDIATQRPLVIPSGRIAELECNVHAVPIE